MHLPSILFSLTLLPLTFTSALTQTPQSSFHIASESSQSATEPITLRTHTHSDDHTHFTHHAFPDHKIRIKETTGWCETREGVRGWSGYLDVKDRDAMFFYFFESRSNPAKDDVIFWINGGPGASSAFGLFMELGPCRISPGPLPEPSNPLPTGPTLLDNPDSWNTNANIFFLDQPAGVGFSYSKLGKEVVHRRTEVAAEDVRDFINIFFQTFSEFNHRPFHMAGESYGGRYIPVLASAVLDGNKRNKAEGRPEVNLKSVMIGNGWTDSVTMMEGYLKQQCTGESGVAPIQSISKCVELHKALPYCQEQLLKECRYRNDPLACAAGVDFCESTLIGAFRETGRNWYDISEDCPEGVCKTAALDTALREYMNFNTTRETLGIDPEWEGPWSLSSSTVAAAFGGISGSNSDLHDPTYLYVAGLLERGIRVLVYVGKVDFACNFIGVRGWVNKLEWSGAALYKAAKEQTWSIPHSKEIAGEVRHAMNLTFATIRGAGHLVPLNKPKEALHMLQSWLAEKPL